MILGGSTYYELLRDNYRPRGGKWVKMSKEEAKEYDNDPNINEIFVLNMDDSSDDSDYPMISMNLSTTKMVMLSSHSRSGKVFLTNCYLYFHFSHVDILPIQFSTYT